MPEHVERRVSQSTIQKCVNSQVVLRRDREGRINVDDMHHLACGAELYPAGPVCKRYDPHSAFVD